MANQRKPGDIDAPIEDVEVPLAFKVFVLFLLSLAVGVAIAVAIALIEQGSTFF
ncbi:MAG: hypothetical protein GYB68_04730 [Chloroflexi bacterium]|nr:hypothetical protein [Chloroflexota bacterium]